MHVLPDALVSKYVVWGVKRNATGAYDEIGGQGDRGLASRSWVSVSRIATAHGALLFTENETNTERLFGTPKQTPYVKDGINNYVVHGQRRTP